MQKNLNKSHDPVSKIFEFTANLIKEQNKTPDEAKSILVHEGLQDYSATVVIKSVQQQFKKARRELALKDILHGGLWCTAGFIAVISGLGLIFWGAIAFGAIQFIKGLVNSI